ncbi:MAG: hypothetical protein QOE68_2239 [Thermoanaerobaculia bacterium]|nr:hypothetical protein [Thermoanaerobaculia bacterium]
MSEDRYVDSPPGGAEAWREVWQSDVRYRSRDGVLGWLRRLMRRVSGPDLDRQKDFNIAALDLLRDVRNDVEAHREDFRRDLEALQGDLRQALTREMPRLRELIEIAAKRNDALIAAIDQKIETVAARYRDITTPLLPTVDQRPATDIVYRRLEDALRGKPDVDEYVALSRDHQPAVDIGCGRGEFLIACRDSGIDARGFDINERSVADLKARGIDAVVAGIPQCLDAVADQSVGAILAMHVVEHIPVETLFSLFAHAERVLKPGGLLMIETPNAESLLVSACEFWRDPTHLAPRHPAALSVLAREHGFAIDEARAIHPLPEGNQLPWSEDDSASLRRIVTVINERLFGPQDVRLILRRS